MASAAKIQGLRYHHLLVAVTNLEVSTAFYEKVGFRRLPDSAEDASPRRLKNTGGLEVHLFQSKRGWTDGKNGLMDLGDVGEKYPGHTHMSFGVRSVANTRSYFESEEAGLAISGTRRHLALFIRDPDRTVLEFERNDGGDDPELKVNADVLSATLRGGIDHIGTRISNPHEHAKWYARALGLSNCVMSYPANVEEPRKNERPWIIRSEHGREGSEFDENLILNATTTGKNILLDAGEDPLPGIVYAAVEVEDIDAAARTYRELYGEESIINEADSARWGIPQAAVSAAVPPSVFVRDPDLNVFRLIVSGSIP